MSEAAPYCYEYPRPALAVDVVILRLSNYADCSSAECHEILLIQRAHPPFPGHWALPGGFVDEGETPQAAAMREAREETGLAVTALQEVGVFAEPGRDPRGWVVSVAFVTRLSGGSDAEAGDDARALRWWPLAGLPPLAFDHASIIDAALDKLGLRQTRLRAT